MTLLFSVAASAVGALARLIVDAEIKRRRPTPMPWATITINITGSALIGVLAGLVMSHHAPDSLQIIGGTGFCGGYTTFSSASFETVRLLEQRRGRRSALNALLTLGGSVAACAAAMAAVTALGALQ